MSKLGNVYVICIDKDIKDKYPVVYMNKSYIYCKVHGSDSLKLYVNPESSTASSTYSYEEFKRGYEAGEVNSRQEYKIYVPANVKTFFEWIKESTPEEQRIRQLKESIAEYDKRIQAYRDRVESATDAIGRNMQYKKDAQDEIEILRASLSKGDN